MSLADLRGRRDLFSVGYAALVESIDDAIIEASLDGTVLSWNAGAERMCGLRAEEALGQRWCWPIVLARGASIAWRRCEPAATGLGSRCP